MSLQGRIHSTESFGSVDGPGIRFIIFLKGCAMRCRYCHNPDTWDAQGGELMTVNDLLERAERYRSYWGTEGGITVSGGEALLQMDFVTELFEEAKRRGINTCLDTAGQPFRSDAAYLARFDRLMDATDLVLLDLKHMDNEAHRRLTGHGNENILQLAQHLSRRGTPVWVRHVLVPGITDSEEHLLAMRNFIATLNNVQKVEVLPYHTLGVFKWQQLGIPYELEGVPTPSQEELARARKIIDNV